MMPLNPLNPDHKPQFKDGDAVEFIPDGNTEGPLYKGKIVGIAVAHIIDHWIILLDTPVPGYPWSAVSIPHTFIRRAGSNEPFPCQWGRESRDV
jgi:hypothetical protein